MKKLFREMTSLLRNGESFVVATVFNKTGSAPRSDGSKMVVRADGSIIGSVGGGRLEADALHLAVEVFQCRQPRLHSFTLTGEDAAGMAMICGGQGEILLDYIDADSESNLLLFDEVAAVFHRQGTSWLVTAFDDSKQNVLSLRQRCLIKADGAMVGSIDCAPGTLAALVSGPGRKKIHAEHLDNRHFLVEPIRDPGTLYIFGAGHVSQKIAPLAETVGFRTVVLDDRAEFANRQRFTEPTEIVLLESFSDLPELAVDGNSYIAIVTRGHLQDKVVLAQALKTTAGYIGMIGSRRKRDKIYQELLRQGFDRGDLERVYSPIGTEIKAETPEEIAVSIVGELIKVRAERQKWEKAKT